MITQPQHAYRIPAAHVDLDAMTTEEVDAWIETLQSRVQRAYMDGAMAVGAGDAAAILEHTEAAGVALRQWADACDWMCARLRESLTTTAGEGR